MCLLWVLGEDGTEGAFVGCVSSVAGGGGWTLQRSVPSAPFERCAEAQGVNQDHTATHVVRLESKPWSVPFHDRLL